MKLRTATIFLLLSSIIWLILEIYSTILRFQGPLWDFYKGNLLNLFLPLLMLLVPVSLLLFSIAILKNKTPGISIDSEEILTYNDSQTPSVRDWLINFLVMLIPVAGIIFAVIWANDDTNKIRKNWAIASLIWTGIMLVLLIIVYIGVLAYLRKNTNLYF